MLLPSALSCDTSHRNAPATRFQSALFASPPTSPVANAHSTLFATCRALQSMLSSPNQLPTPPVNHAPPPGNALKLRLRARKPTVADGGSNEMDSASASRSMVIRRKKVTKRTNAPRGINKRRRAIEDETGHNEDGEADNQVGDKDMAERDAAPSTPKRLRLAPEVLPMGLEWSDFWMLQTAAELDRMEAATVAPPAGARDDSVEGDSATWTSEEDRMLVELVLEKLKLSKSDWQDCARSLGKDRGSVGRRWKSLMGGGEIGLKRSTARRSKIHGTWR